MDCLFEGRFLDGCLMVLGWFWAPFWELFSLFVGVNFEMNMKFVPRSAPTGQA